MDSHTIICNSIRGDNGQIAGKLTSEELYQAIVATHEQSRYPGIASRQTSSPTNPGRDDSLGLPPSLEASCGNLAKTRWGIIVPAPTNHAAQQSHLAAHLQALEPLFAHRREQMDISTYEFQQYIFEYEPGMTVETFLRVSTYDEVTPGNMEPEIMPYYLTIIGSPEAIPWAFQQRLDGEYAVGRIWFTEIEDCIAYVGKLVAHEQASLYAQQGTSSDSPDLLTDQNVLLVSPEFAGDNATHLSTQNLTLPLAEWLGDSSELLNCKVDLLHGSDPEHEATKVNLISKLDSSTISLLCLATHGLEILPDRPQQRAIQGALLLQEWPGKSVPATKEHFLSGDMIDETLDLSGTMAICFACHGAGTPIWPDWIVTEQLEARHRLTYKPFIAMLPQKLLAQGMLAFVGHVSRTWSCSFMNPSHTRAQHRTYREFFHQLLTGKPIGHAVDYLNTRGVRLSETLNDELERGNSDVEYINLLWITRNDCRGYVTLGDPATRIFYISNKGFLFDRNP
ncbi:MAG: hypothetical protein AAF702_16605 [Chloroflexota bacterium]